jgi:hypothetical protein
MPQKTKTREDFERLLASINDPGVTGALLQGVQSQNEGSRRQNGGSHLVGQVKGKIPDFLIPLLTSGDFGLGAAQSLEGPISNAASSVAQTPFANSMKNTAGAVLAALKFAPQSVGYALGFDDKPVYENPTYENPAVLPEQLHAPQFPQVLMPKPTASPRERFPSSTPQPKSQVSPAPQLPQQSVAPQPAPVDQAPAQPAAEAQAGGLPVWAKALIALGGVGLLAAVAKNSTGRRKREVGGIMRGAGQGLSMYMQDRARAAEEATKRRHEMDVIAAKLEGDKQIQESDVKGRLKIQEEAAALDLSNAMARYSFEHPESQRDLSGIYTKMKLIKDQISMLADSGSLDSGPKIKVLVDEYSRLSDIAYSMMNETPAAVGAPAGGK